MQGQTEFLRGLRCLNISGFCLQFPVDGRCWLSIPFKFQLMCQVPRRGTFSETFLLLRTCSSTTLGGTVIAKLLAIVTHRQTFQLTDHRPSLHWRFSPSAIWRSEDCQRGHQDPFPIDVSPQTRPFSSVLVVFQDDRPWREVTCRSAKHAINHGMTHET